jgi:hypothetical protein
VLGLALVSLIAASASLADNPVVTATSVTSMNANASAVLTGTSISGYSNASQPLLVSVSTTIGSLSMTQTSGLTLSYGYSTFSGSSFSFVGNQAAVQAGLATLTLTDSGTTGTTSVAVTVTGNQTGIAYLPATGHYYQYVPSTNITWTAAQTAAAGLTFAGQSGYLASIPSATVNSFIQAHLPGGASNVWAGGMSIDYPSGLPGNTSIHRVWSWQNGPLAATPFTECTNISTTCVHSNDTGDYYDWNTGEPNNSGYSATTSGSGEHYLEINYLGNAVWNDIPNTTTIAGYVAEFGDLTNGGNFTGVYSATASITLAASPSAPTGVSAVGGSVAGGQAAVSWTAPASNGGSPITSYTVVASGGAGSCTTSGATTCTVTGLTNGSSYTFTVAASNGIAPPATSSPSSSTTISGLPSAPTGASAVAGAGQATVSWTAPSGNGSSISGYTATSSPGGFTCAWTSGPTQCTVAGLTNGTSYTFTVNATNANGTGGPSSASSAVTPIAVPGAPTGVSAFGGSAAGGQASVSWTAPASNGGSAITGYTVTASGGAGSCSTTGATSCTIIGLTNASSYTFRVTATNIAGNSALSTASSSTIVSGLPSAPTGVSAIAAAGQATVSWTAPSGNGSSISGYTATSSPGGFTCAWTSGPTQCTVVGLTNGTSYTFTVNATNANGTGGPSSASSAVTPIAVPGAPTAVSAFGGSAAGGQASVSWTAPASNGGSAITGYTVTASGGAGSCSTTGATSCTIIGLTNASSYTFRVTATNIAGNSALSTASSSTIVSGLPSAPTGVSAIAAAGQATVSWTAPSGNGSSISGYTATSSPGGFTCAWTSGPTQCTVVGLTNGTSYTFTVNATNANGTGVPSTPSNAAIPLGVPSPPTAVLAFGGSAAGGQAVVSWSAPNTDGGTAVTGYTATASDGVSTCTTNGALACTITGLTDNTSYTVTVTATNLVGTSDPSAASTGTMISGLPDPPSGVSAVAGAGQATVSWTAPSGNGSSISGYTATSSPGGFTCAWTSGPTQCSVVGLSDGTSYTFTVNATNGNGTGVPSTPSNAAIPLGVPSPPTAVLAFGGSAAGGQAVVSWSAPNTDGASAVTGYTVTASDGVSTCTTNGALACTITGLTNVSSYTFTVTATNLVGTSDPSAASTGTMISGLPDPPSGVSAVAGAGQATVSWTAPSGEGSSIWAYTATSSPGGYTCTWTTGPTQCAVTGLTDGTSYTFTVDAINGNGPGSPSDPSSAVTSLGVPSPPTAVLAFGGSAAGGQAVVSWSAPNTDGGTAVTGYTATASDGVSTCTTNGALTCTIAGLTNNTSYTVTVTATNLIGTSDPSGASAGTTVVEFPGAPVIQAPADQTDTNNNEPTFSGTADPNTTVIVLLGGSPIGTTSADGAGDWTFTPQNPIADGTYAVTATATDSWSNVSPPSASTSLTIDTVAPVAPVVVTPSNGSTSNNASPTVTVTGEPGTSAVVDVDGSDYGPVTVDSSGDAQVAIPGPLSAGQHSVSTQLTDGAGNVSSWSAVSIWTVKLSTSVQLNGPTGGPTTASTPTVNYVGEAGDQYTITVDGQSVLTGVIPASGAGSVTLPTPLSDGAHTIAITVTDVAGNQASDSIVVTIDTAAPDAVQIVQAPAAVTNSAAATFSFTDNEPGVQYQCSLDGSTWSTCPTPDTYTGLSNGPHTLLVRAVDPAGNASVSTQYAWTVNTTPPPPPVILGGPPPVGTPGGNTFTLSQAPGTTLQCSLDGGAYEPCPTNYNPGQLALGKHTLQVVQIDEAGNVSMPNVYSWIIMRKAGPQGLPTTARLLVAPNATAAGGSSLEVGCNLNAGSVRRCTVTLYHHGHAVGSGVTLLSKRGNAHAVVTVRLNARGRALLAKAIGGLPVTLRGTALPFGFRALPASTRTVLFAPLRYVVPDVLFKTDSSKLTRAAHAIIKALARQLSGAETIVCEGNTDRVGSDAYNHALGLRRARAVCTMLQTHGVKARFTAMSYGDQRPVASNSTAAGRALNRRVVIRVSYNDLPPAP